MSDPKTYTDDGSARRLPLVAWALIVTLLAGFFFIGPIAEVNDPPRAAGAALTHVTNVSTGKLSSFITIRKDNGVVVDIVPQADVWGVRSYIIRNGTCVSRNGASPICATSGSKEIALASGSNNLLRRTK